jgi:predicted histone-like DNA-binding protein
MSINYKLVERGNPSNRELPKKFYALAVRKETVSIEKVANLVAGKTSLDHVDTEAAVKAVVDIIIHELEEGRAVQLGSLGTFAVRLSSEGAESADKFNVSAIKKAKVMYRPSRALEASARNYIFERLS